MSSLGLSPIELGTHCLRTGEMPPGVKLVGLVEGGGFGCVANAGELKAFEDQGWFDPIKSAKDEPSGVFKVLGGESGGGFNAGAALARQAHGLGPIYIDELPREGYVDAWRALSGQGPLVMPSILQRVVGDALDIKAATSNPTALLTGATRLDDFSHHTFSTEDGSLTKENALEIFMRGSRQPIGTPMIDDEGHFWGDSELSNVFLQTVLRKTDATHVIVFANKPPGRYAPNPLSPLIHRKIGQWVGNYHAWGPEAGLAVYREAAKDKEKTKRQLATGYSNVSTAAVQFVFPAAMEDGVRQARAGTTNQKRLRQTHAKGIDGAALALAHPETAPVIHLQPLPERLPAPNRVAQIAVRAAHLAWPSRTPGTAEALSITS